MSDDWIVNGMATINIKREDEPRTPAEPKKRTLRQRTLYTSHSSPDTASATPALVATSTPTAAVAAAAASAAPAKKDDKDKDQPMGDPRTPRPITKKPTPSDEDLQRRLKPRPHSGGGGGVRPTTSQEAVLPPLHKMHDNMAYRPQRHAYAKEQHGNKYDKIEDAMPLLFPPDDVKYITGHLTAMATPHGTMSMTLRGRIRVDMTVDQAIRVINFETNIVMAMSASGGNVGLLHPNGRIWQYGSRVEIMAHDPEGNNKYAKMTYKGVGFTSDHCALVYLVDSAGTRTTTDIFTDMMFDYTLRLFYEESRHGVKCVPEAMDMLKAAHYWQTEDGEDNWCVNGVRISQSRDGLVKIARNSNKYRMRTSPTNGTASITTPFLHCTASLGHTQHLFVRRGERRMHFDGSSFIVRNAGHSAGFDEKNQVKVY